MSKLLNKIRSLTNRNEPTTESNGLEAFEGTPEYRAPMSTYRVSYEFIPLNKLAGQEVVQKLSEELNCPFDVVREDLVRLTKGMATRLVVCLEYPYVDEYYRDTYYAYFARKVG